MQNIPYMTDNLAFLVDKNEIALIYFMEDVTFSFKNVTKDYQSENQEPIQNTMTAPVREEYFQCYLLR